MIKDGEETMLIDALSSYYSFIIEIYSTILIKALNYSCFSYIKTWFDKHFKAIDIDTVVGGNYCCPKTVLYSKSKEIHFFNSYLLAYIHGLVEQQRKCYYVARMILSEKSRYV